VEAGLADGVGVVLVGDGLSGVDLDHCVDPETGRVTDWALAIVDEIDTYTERSPSGTGLRILAHGSLPPGGRKRGDVEMYDTLRFLSITGQHVAGTPTVIHERGEALAAVHRRVFGAPVRSEPERRGVVYLERDDAALLRRAHDARNGAKFGMLWRGDTSAYPSPSEADLGLVSMLVYWTGGDAARVDRLFRQSALYRPKWDAARGSDTYGERTIARAIARCG
jgi:primase-polymerase (primpol)-like protein